MVHNHWLVGFGSQEVTSVSYGWSLRHGGCCRDRSSHPGGDCAYGSGAWASSGPYGTVSGVRWDDARYDCKDCPERRESRGVPALDTVAREPNFFPEPWLTSLRLTTTRPARQRWAAAESRSFERCVPTTSCRDRAPASSIPLRAHGPPAARICTSATAMRTRCGEGDLVGGWHAGASPFTPITRWVTNRGSSSASLAHTYTPLGRSQRL